MDLEEECMGEIKVIQHMQEDSRVDMWMIMEMNMVMIMVKNMRNMKKY
jgi:hypothetical protein